MTGGAPGWYGKLPVLGDFAHRRLPADFIAAWDAWLQEGLGHSRGELGNDWLDSYLTAHVWHFVLLPGVLGAHTWTGVWMPSVDRVGRYFPLTLARALHSPPQLSTSFGGLAEWLRGLEECARLALRLVDGIEAFEDALAALAAPPDSVRWPRRIRRLSEMLARDERLIELPAADSESFPSASLVAVADCCLEIALTGHSLWWCHGSDGQSGGFLHQHLPAASFMTKMLTYSPAGSIAANIRG
ncbi:MAG: type VI secretion system-associated protein TagF [Candidatus Accumulibacter sp.]|uniref:type VI secretion system-associated protein TagF n=1 Tax=Accumulibacter sp. TaxID=2053492 RepID=UPI00287AACDE|nr:type VI secretion system-associated protein TagF [Accumulibacter sp.]MDS4015082.1 type VI secretion system-associated protein TagF [Accumulibacter sp.]